MKQRPPFSRFWELYRMGGLSPAIQSIFHAENAQQIAYLRSLLKDKRKHDLHHMPLHQLQIVVFDLETTGFFPEQGDEIIAIGAVALSGNRFLPDETFYSLVHPKRLIPPPVEQLTAITNEMVSEAPDMADVLLRFFRFVKRRILIAHGAGHDGKFLNAALRKTFRASLTHRLLDTMMIGCKLYPDFRHYTLDDWLRFYNHENIGRHHALNDSLMTAKLWISLVDDMRSRNLHTLGDLYSFLGRS